MQSYLGPSSSSQPSSSSPVASFFKDRQASRLCLAFFDARRGEKEGHEYEKVLAFFPTTAALSIRTGIVGLAQAFASFSSSFAPHQPSSSRRHGGPAKFMEAEQRKWAMLEVEPDIWLVLVVSKAWVGQGCSNETMQSSLAALHSLFTLLHGPMSLMLDQDPSGFFIRRVLQPFMDEAGSRLQAADMKDPVSLLNPLGMQGGLPLLPTPKPIFLGVQCLVNQLLIASVGSSRPVCGAMACWKGHLLWGSLPLADCEALTLLACRALGPASSLSMKGNKSAGAFQDPTPSASETLLSPHQWAAASSSSRAASSPLGGSNSSSRAGGLFQAPSGPVSSLLAYGSLGGSSRSLAEAQSGPAAMGGLPQQPLAGPSFGFLTPRLRQPSLPQPDSMLQDSLQVQHQRQRQPAVQTARVWLQASQQQCLLLPYFDGPLMVLALLDADVVLTQDVAACISDVLVRECPPLCALLSRTLARKNQWHHPGYRYCVKDETLGSVRATPGNKVSTLSQQSLRLLGHMSNKLEYWSHRDRDSSRPDSPVIGAEPSSAGQAAGETAAGAAAVGNVSVEEARLENGGNGGQGCSASSWGTGSCGGHVTVACRGFSDSSAWVVGRKESGRTLLVVMEAVPDPSLSGVAQHAQRLCDVAAPGLFL